MTSELLAAALDYAANGFAVFPLAAGSAIPLKDSHGHLDATREMSVIETWAENANIGIATRASGLLVLDVDPRNLGHVTLADLEAQHGRLPETFTVRSKRGGLHYYFRAPEDDDTPRGTDRLGPGLDLPNYVVAAGSVVDGVTYEVVHDLPIADAPGWVIERARGSRAAGPTAYSADPAAGSVDAAQRWSAQQPCPVCDGWARLPQGRGIRCHGYASGDGHYARCSREEHAGPIEPGPDGLYAHFLGDGCRCGASHGARFAPNDDALDRRAQPGGTFILDAPAEIPALWGSDSDVFWADGEALMIVGPDGVGSAW